MDRNNIKTIKDLLNKKRGITVDRFIQLSNVLDKFIAKHLKSHENNKKN